MSHFRSTFFKKNKYALFITLAIIFLLVYIENISYNKNTSEWLHPFCNNKIDCVKILLVADPQIIGKQNEVIHPITPFTIIDSDRYLKKTYSVAYDFVKPDIVIFLGDLMDEGSTASNKDFHEYVSRLFDIFLNSDSPTVRHIWLPGDNDIGGEGLDRVTLSKQKRFQEAFDQPDVLNIRNITFVKINQMMSVFPTLNEVREFYETNKIVLGLSHMPIMFKPSPFSSRVLGKLLPHALFTAHEHKSMIISMDALIQQDRHITPVTPFTNEVFELTLGSSDMHEIIVPTCSYRMGTSNIGYGYAVLEKNDLRYTVLWSPSRFPQLGVYAIVIFIILILALIKCILSCLRF